jgi:hypothetical protein
VTKRQSLLSLFLLPLGAAVGWWTPRALSRIAAEREVRDLSRI